MRRRGLLAMFLLAVPMTGTLMAHGVSASDHDLITMGRQLAVFI